LILRNVPNKSSQEVSRLLRVSKISLVWQGVGYETISSELSAPGSQRNRPPGKEQPTAICIGFSRTAKLLLGEAVRGKKGLVSSLDVTDVHVDPAFGPLHRVDVGNIANVSEPPATSIFSVEVRGARQCSCIIWYDRHILLSQLAGTGLHSFLVGRLAYFFKARTVEPEKQPLLGNGCVTRNNG
jgi:hypothetical protein